MKRIKPTYVKSEQLKKEKLLAKIMQMSDEELLELELAVTRRKRELAAPVVVTREPREPLNYFPSGSPSFIHRFFDW